MTRSVVTLIFAMFIAVVLSMYIFININPHSNENSKDKISTINEPDTVK